MGHSTKIFAHRGANREAAENTRAAFNRALEYPIDGMETDVQMTRDGVLVLWHDWKLEKLGYPDRSIEDFDYTELEQLNFASFFSGLASEHVVTLEEFLQTYRDCCQLQIEIKSLEAESNQRRENKIFQILNLIGEINSSEIFISSFNTECLQIAHRISPHIPLYLALSETQDERDVRFFLKQYPYLTGFCLAIQNLTTSTVETLQKNHKAVAVYTCNTDDEIRAALYLGVNILITDNLQRALHLRTQL